MVTLLTITLTAACCIAVALLLVGDRRAGGADSSWVTPSMLAVFTASSATLSTLAYAISGADGDRIVPLVIGDVTMPLSVGLLVATLRRAAGKRRSFAGSALVISLAVGAITLLVSIEAGYVAKLIVLALFSALATLTCVRAAFPPLGAWLVGGSTAVYSAYSLVRLFGPVVFGRDSAAIQAVVGLETATAVATVVVAVVAIGVIVIFRRSDAPEPSAVVNSEVLTDWIGALLSQHSAFTALAASVPDLPLHRAAFGRAWTQSITAALIESTITTLPTGSVVGRVTPHVLVAIQFGEGLDVEAVRSRLQQSYEGMLPRSAPTEPPDVLVERLEISDPADLRRFARRSRIATRRTTSLLGGR